MMRVLQPGRLSAGAIAALLVAAPVSARPQASVELRVVPVAETVVTRLPMGDLHWHVERFASRTEAKRGAAAGALIVADGPRIWRFTLTGVTGVPGGALVAVIGPVPVPTATRYLLRVNRASGPPGAITSVHTHPGSESFFVRQGALCQRSRGGTARIEAGQLMRGRAPGLVMQLRSCGAVALDQFVLFVVDADKPFSSPAHLD